MNQVKRLSIKYDDINKEIEQYFLENIVPKLLSISSYDEYLVWYDRFLASCVNRSNENVRNPWIILVHSYLYNFDWYVNRIHGSV